MNTPDKRRKNTPVKRLKPIDPLWFLQIVFTCVAISMLSQYFGISDGRPPGIIVFPVAFLLTKFLPIHKHLLPNLKALIKNLTGIDISDWNKYN